MTAAFPLFLIPLLPLLGAAFSLLVGKRAGKSVVTLVACGAVGAAFLVAANAVYTMATQLPPGGSLTDRFFDAPFIKAGDLTLSAGLLLDHLSAVLVLIITFVGLLIHIYSTAYMEHDEGYTRFFGYLNLFTGAMLILVLGDSMPVTFVGWEGVGLCSYLLIGFWFDKEANADAGRKAFVVNRIGDFGMLLAMFLLFTVAGTLKYTDLATKIDLLRTPLWFGWPAAYFAGLLILVGATGKSAQIPLYVWLPDAMAGPTPVSALIHAATMVTAGVYVVARMHFVFESGPISFNLVIAIGAATALFAATIGIAQRDLKKVLAYSTISQLGFMFAAVGSYTTGTSNYHAGIFHLATHAFFKAGLFLGAGSVMHALNGEGDIMRMGGLKKYLPHTRWTFLICCLSIAGIFPFAGFWSKDAILGGALEFLPTARPGAGALEVFFAQHGGQVVYAVLVAAAACTAFYMFRLYFLVFEGEFRGSDEERHHLHESPPAMTVVLWILAIGSFFVGLLGVPDVVHEGADLFGHWLDPIVAAQIHEESARSFWLGAGFTLSISAAAIGLAWFIYGGGLERARRMASTLPGVYRLLLHKYYVDEIYNLIIVRPFRFTASFLWNVIDKLIIDMLVSLTAFIVDKFGRLARLFQSGDAQRYVVGILVGTAGMIHIATNYAACTAVDFAVETQGNNVVVTPKAGGEDAARLQYRVDWEGSGTFTPAAAQRTLSHHYQTGGPKKITVEALDPRWDTGARKTKAVVLQ